MSLVRHAPVFGTVLLLAGLTATLDAQTRVTGQVTDSLTGQPFAGAIVQLIPQDAPWSAGRTTRADSTGRFRIDSVPAGTYTFGFTHPRLDSLGMDAVTRTLGIAAGATTIEAPLTLPSATTLAKAFCGARTDTTGAMIGRVIDAQSGAGRGGAHVTVRWGELVMQQGNMRSSTAMLSTTAADDGRYLLCGVPTDVAVFLQAADADTARARDGGTARDSSGAIEVQFAPGTPLLHRDLLLASSTRNGTSAGAAAIAVTARLTGRILTPDGSPLRGARVRLANAGAASEYAVTDSAGSFRLASLAAGTQTVQVIAIGFSPTRVAVDLRADVEARVTVRMRESVYTLEGVKVYGALSRDAAAFADRARKGGLGFFVTGDEVRKRGQALVSFALLRAPGLRLTDTQFGRPVIGGSFNCTPRFFLDGWEIASDELDRFVSVEGLGGIEVYRQPVEVPPQLMRSMLVPVEVREPCSMVFVWSKAVIQ